MKIGITYRMFLAILTATFLAVVCMFLIMQWSIDRGFLRYVNSMEEKRITRLAGLLEESYAAHGNWNFLRNDPAIFAGSLPHQCRKTRRSNRTDHAGVRREGPPAEINQPGMLFLPPPPPHFGMPVVLLDAIKTDIRPVNSPRIWV
jgi:two-component system sensor histidine kinase BaeS